MSTPAAARGLGESFEPVVDRIVVEMRVRLGTQRHPRSRRRRLAPPVLPGSASRRQRSEGGERDAPVAHRTARASLAASRSSSEYEFCTTDDRRDEPAPPPARRGRCCWRRWRRFGPRRGARRERCRRSPRPACPDPARGSCTCPPARSRAARGCPRSAAGSGRATRPRSDGSPTTEWKTFVVSAGRCPRSAIHRPIQVSLLPPPYASAVSNRVNPSSQARVHQRERLVPPTRPARRTPAPSRSRRSCRSRG